MLSKKIVVLFWLEVVFFVIVLISMFTELLRGKVFLVPMILLGLTGLLLLFYSWREKRWWLVLTGGSAAGFFLFGVLHNLFYALAELSTIGWLDKVLEVLSVTFFLIAVIACPLGFIVGVVGSIWMLLKKGKK